MKNPFEYWKGRKGLEMWAVLDEGEVVVPFPFDTDLAERLQRRQDYVGAVHHLTRNEGCFMVSVDDNTDECDSLESAVTRARELAATKVAV